MSGRTTRRRRRRGGRGRPGCLSVLLFVVLFVAAFFAVTAIFFRIETIDVIGNEHYRPDEVINASEVERGDNLIFFNKFSAVSKIFNSLPYVEEVQMLRDIPNRLVITVQEAHAAAYVAAEDGYWLLSPNGKLLEKVRTTPEGVIAVTGLELDSPEVGKQAKAAGEDASKVDTLAAVMTALDENEMLSAVSKISLDGVYDVSLIFLDRFTVELGMPEQLDYKLEFLLEVVDRLGSEANGVIDMSELVEQGEARFRPYS